MKPLHYRVEKGKYYAHGHTKNGIRIYVRIISNECTESSFEVVIEGFLFKRMFRRHSLDLAKAAVDRCRERN